MNIANDTITAIAGIHRRLYTSDDVRHVDMGAYLATLLSELDASMKGQGRNVRLSRTLEPLNVPTDPAKLGTGGLLGWVFHILSAWQAYSYAKSNPRYN